MICHLRATNDSQWYPTIPQVTPKQVSEVSYLVQSPISYRKSANRTVPYDPYGSSTIHPAYRPNVPKPYSAIRCILDRCPTNALVDRSNIEAFPMVPKRHGRPFQLHGRLVRSIPNRGHERRVCPKRATLIRSPDDDRPTCSASFSTLKNEK